MTERLGLLGGAEAVWSVARPLRECYHDGRLGFGWLVLHNQLTRPSGWNDKQIIAEVPCYADSISYVVATENSQLLSAESCQPSVSNMTVVKGRRPQESRSGCDKDRETSLV